jgi:predicted GIY-YIG superfamily endonuclease
MYIVYGLEDPRTKQTRYVGITDNVFARFTQHIQCLGGNQAKNAWMQELRKENIMPLMIEFERTDDRSHALKRETYWIRHFYSLNYPLLNIVKTTESMPARVVSMQKWGGAKAPITTEDEQAAVDAWNNGAMSQRMMCKALGITEHRARQLRKHLFENGLVNFAKAQ